MNIIAKSVKCIHSAAKEPSFSVAETPCLAGDVPKRDRTIPVRKAELRV